MKRLLIAIGSVAPSLLLLFFALQPEADRAAVSPLFHFYIVTFTSFAAAVISILLTVLLGGVAPPRHILASIGFATIGTLFFSHGLATPEAIIDHFHPAVRWSAWLTLFGGGVLFVLAAAAPFWLPIRRVVTLTVAGMVGYFAFALIVPQGLEFMEAQSTIWQRMMVFLGSFALWLYASYCFWRTWRLSRNQVDGVLAVVSFWIAQATISLHLFPIWRLSWWLYHFMLLAAFLFVLYMLAFEYERARQFRVLWYFLGLSLMLTALLALVGSHLFSTHLYGALRSEVESSSLASANRLASDVTTALPANPTSEQIANGMLNLPSDDRNITIYDLKGTELYQSKAEMRLLSDVAEFRRAAVGEAAIKIYSSDRSPPPAGHYTSDKPYHHIVTTYVPIGKEDAPTAVLVTRERVSTLNQAMITARATGLTISGLMMGLLLAALLGIVRRADHIIITRTNQLDQARRKSDELLLNILPPNIAEELKQQGQVMPVHHECVTVMFTDFKNFTRIASQLTPQELVKELDFCFSHFDRIAQEFNIEKLKTIGDSYMCASGVPRPNKNHAINVVMAAFKIQTFMRDRKAQKLKANQPYWDIRIGIHSGPLVAGVIGDQKFSYDVWGDTVNTASRMESASEAGKINISHSTYELIKGLFQCQYRGKMPVKNKEPLHMYFVIGVKNSEALKKRRAQ
ncbi:MAG: adenylate/guanylate cyclase domain-containing protein [Ardenticatenaceae bacterium]